MKKLMQVDLSSLATPVEPKKRVYKKRKVEEKVEEKVEDVEERPTKGGKSIKSFPVKEKKPPTEKQLAAREKMRLARAAKIEQVKAEKAKLDEEIRLKEEEVQRKKAELAEKRRLKREEKKALLPQKPVIQTPPAQTGTVEDLGPSISETLKSLAPKDPEPRILESIQETVEENNQEPVQESFQEPQPPSTPIKSLANQKVPDAPKREYAQRFRTFPFGKPLPIKPRFR